MGYDALRLAIAGHHRLTTPKPFPDRRERLFGRERDLEALCARVRLKGLTAVAARPQMGKSWLLTELARRLSEDHEPRHLVGFAESAGETPDLLLRTVIDLYARWLSDAGYGQQARMVWEQQKPNLLPGVAKTVAKIFKEIVGKAAKPVAVAVEDAINGLIAADQSLKTGGVQLPTLSYEQARDLVAAVATISGSRSRSSWTNGKNRRTSRASPRRWMPSSAIWRTGRTATSSWRCAPRSPPTARCRSSWRAWSGRSRSIRSNRCSSPTRPSRHA